jgi:hypothetical protein
MNASSLQWRKSSHSGSSNTCVELASHPAGHVLVRNSNHPDAGTLAFSPAVLGTLLASCRAGALDDLR